MKLSDASKFLLYSAIENRLSDEVEKARVSFEARTLDADGYARILKRFSEFVIEGRFPDDWGDTLQPMANASPGLAGISAEIGWAAN